MAVRVRPSTLRLLAALGLAAALGGCVAYPGYGYGYGYGYPYDYGYYGGPTVGLSVGGWGHRGWDHDGWGGHGWGHGGWGDRD